MSRVGIGSNLIQPDAKCMRCRYWRNAEPNTIFGHIAGMCTVGYCKKRFDRRGRRK